MSKFKFIPSEGGRLTTLFHEDRFIHAFYVDDLPDLATAAQAALAEQRAANKQCKCKSGWDTAEPEEICEEFIPGSMNKGWCETCGHDEACHQPQAQRRET